MTEDQDNQFDAAESPEVEKLWDLFEAEKFEETIIEAAKYIEENKDADPYVAKRLIGLAAFRLGQYAKSQETFVDLTGNYGGMEDWFNLLTSSTLNNDIELGEKSFYKIVDIFKDGSEEPGISLPNVYFYYLNALADVGQFEKGFERLLELLEYYVQLKITDSNFLYMRGMPFLQDTLSVGRKILENAGRDKCEEILDRLEKNLDEEGIEMVKGFRGALSY